MTRSVGLPALATLLLSACLSGTFTGGEDGAGGDGDDGAGDDGSDVGDDGSGDGPAPTPDAAPPPEYQIALAPLSSELVLGESKTFTVTITGENGFAGPVALAATGVPESWQVTIEPATVDVIAGSEGTATVTLVVPTDAEVATAMLAIEATSTLVPGPHTTPPADVTVKPELVIRIPPGSVDNPDDSFGPGGTVRVRFIQAGTKVTWVNDDTVGHRIHADGVNGFDHQPDNLSPGESYSQTITAPGTYDYNCHLHPQMVGKLIITQGP